MDASYFTILILEIVIILQSGCIISDYLKGVEEQEEEERISFWHSF